MRFLKISLFFQEDPFSFDFEIPKNVNPLPRHSCDLTENEFVEKFVRTRTPVILEDCSGYEWLQKYDFSLGNIAKV